MNESDVQKLIDDSIQNYSSGAQFGVRPIPAHAHTGIDSQQIDGSNIVGPILARVASFTSTATPMPPANSVDLFEMTSQTGAASFQAPYGQAFNGTLLRIRITSSNSATARAVSWATGAGGYLGTTPALPSATTTGQTLTVGFEYDTGNSINKWRLLYTSSS